MTQFKKRKSGQTLSILLYNKDKARHRNTSCISFITLRALYTLQFIEIKYLTSHQDPVEDPSS